jgi:hypothetical protein
MYFHPHLPHLLYNLGAIQSEIFSHVSTAAKHVRDSCKLVFVCVNETTITS